MRSVRPNVLLAAFVAFVLSTFAFQNCSHLDEPTGTNSASSLGVPKENDIEIFSAMMDVGLQVGETLRLENIVQSNSGRPLTYSWTRNSQHLSFTSATLSLTNVSPSDAGIYSLTISNDIDQKVISAQVSVNTTPVASSITISTQPMPLTLANGTAGTLTVAATVTGAATLTYQWYKDNAAISGATTSSYAIAANGPARAGNYYVEVSAGPTVTKVKSNVVKVTATQSFNVNAANGCAGGYCSCVTPGQLNVPYKPSGNLICTVKGYGSVTTFTTVAGPVGATQCNANGAGCYVNGNPGNIVCATVNCTK